MTDPWLVPTLTPEQVLRSEDVVVVDLRSPVEFGKDHPPGARNAPLFDDLERQVVGTLYKRETPQAAFEAGRGFVVGRIASLVSEVAACAGRELPADDLVARVEEMTGRGIGHMNRELQLQPASECPPGALVVLCWRGGLRSGSVATLLRALGWEDVFLLEGGYRDYRRRVVAELEEWSAPPAFVIRGLTGTGKTLVLRELERIRPGWTLDLEGCAGHRSSILGMVGLEPVGQKAFESRLATRVRAGFPGLVVYEGESRKVGDAIIPSNLWLSLDGGVNLCLEATTERRVQVLMEDYLEHAASRDQLRAQLPFIEQRLGPKKWDGELVGLLDAGREPELVEVLLEHYYDPLYKHSEKSREYAVVFESGDVERVAREVAEWIEGRES